MKKNNKFRNSGSSNAYSLNYRFDSISPAGKFSGTALDLIKKYNELAKEAHGSGDYIEMEIYRQYAEHYRKIVTEINERKNNRPEACNNAASSQNGNGAENNTAAVGTDTTAPEAAATQNGTITETQPMEETKLKITAKKSFKIIEIQPQTDASGNEESGEAQPVKRKRCVRRKAESESPVAAAVV